MLRRRSTWIAAAVLVVGIAAAVGWRLYTPDAVLIEQAQQNYDAAMAAQDFAGASLAMRDALDVDENQPAKWLNLGRAELARGALQNALGAFGRVLDYEPENIEALQSAAELSAAGGNYDDAKAYAATLLKLAPDDVRGRIVLVAIAIKERRFADADRQADALIASGISTDDLFLLKARARLQQRDQRGAISLLEARDKAMPGSIGILSDLLSLYTQAGDVAGRRRTQARLLAVQPANVDYQLAAARELHVGGQRAAARDSVAQIQAAHRGEPEVQLKIVDYWRSLEGRGAALAAMRAAVPDGGPAIRIVAAQTILDLGEPKEALALIQPMIAVLPKDRIQAGAVAAWTVYGNILFALGRRAETRDVADHVLAVDSTNAAALLLRARLNLAERRLGEALTDAQLLVQSAPGQVRPALLLARIHATRGETMLAEVAYARARDQFPDNIAVMTQSADYLIGRGSPDQAAKIAVDFAGDHGGSPPARAAMIAVCRRAAVAPCPGA